MYKNLEDQLVQGDEDILEQKSLRNQLEAYSYEMRNNLDSYGSWEKYLDEETKKTFVADINETVDWIYGDGENATLAEYKTRIEKYRQIGEPVKARYFYYSELEVYYAQFEKVQSTIKDKLDVIEHFTDAQKATITKKLTDMETLIAGVKADRAGKQPHENPSYKLDQIIDSIDSTRRDTEAIFNLPAPLKSAEKKAESSTADSGEKKTEAEKPTAPAGDAEMKNEEPKADAK